MASVTVKKARLKVVMSMSRGSTALIVTSSSASLAAVMEVAVPCSEMSSLLLAVLKTSTVKNEFDKDVIIDE
ncbi:uncharacterized protein BDCG_16990 [Blastomyces dermatitidis ER-3]|uniref:Uncharacterized protein n=1 Tax=Ajellomyces dermatitidis (strain ER-3 / ATCC MYA-2586) TaxID=559297 RepID=A0ABX2VVQ8_AJEDR|nr:uncharacterized protein BDCG_16990 [Blastomyces dermatitidis ER-3]OAT01237.1 hypothetical protein BDCG_16990 [Blastomyces dermatitidis ER-3]